MANKLQRIEHEVIATWHERLSGPLTIAGLILLAVTLAGNLGVLFFGFAPGGLALAALRVAPVVGGVVSAIGYAFTGYRWLRILRRLRRFNVKDELTDAGLEALGQAQSRLPKKALGFQPQAALATVAASAVVTVATFAPGPIGFLGAAQSHAAHPHTTTTHTAPPPPTFGAPKAQPGYSMPASAGHNVEGMTAGPDGSVWITTDGGTSGGRIIHVSPKGTITAYAIPTTSAPSAGGGPGSTSLPGDMVKGPDGNLWFVESTSSFHAGMIQGDSAVVRVTPQGKATQYPLPNSELTASNGMGGITAGPDGNLWFLENSGDGPADGPNDGRIARITPSGKITEYHLAAGQYLTNITAGPDGNLWFCAYYLGPAISGPYGPTLPPPANGRIGRITPSGKITLFPVLGKTRYPTNIATGPDGNLWFLEEDASAKVTRIGRITPKGVVTHFAPKGFVTGPSGIIPGPDGNLWLTILPQTDPTTGKPVSGEISAIARLTPKGVLSIYRLPKGYTAKGPLAVGPDHNLWFAETSPTGAAVVGRMYP